MNKISEKFKKDELRFSRITNNDLVCKDCAFRMDDSKVFGNTSRCEIFRVKPDAVINGKSCSEYLKE